MPPVSSGSAPDAANRSSRVAVIMPVRGDSRAYRDALRALGALAPAADAVVIVSDGPPHDAAAAARAAGFAVLELAATRGPAAARNAGVRATDADILLFVDGDVAVAPDLVARVRETMADASIAAAVGCYDAKFPEGNFFSRYKHLLQRFVHLEARGEGGTFWGACGAIRRAVFDSVGGFDERFRQPSVEDIELGYRVRAAGHRIVFRPELEVTHLKRWTLRSLVASDVLRRALPWTWLLVREGRIDATLNVNRRSRAAAAVAWIGALALVAAPFVGVWAAAAGVGAAVALAALDWRLLRFFRAHGGVTFAAQAFVWHWVYYLYSSATLVMGVLSYPIVGRQRVGAPT